MNYTLLIFINGKTIKWGLGIGDWGLGIGDWGLGVGANTHNPKPPAPNPNDRSFFLIID